jgi:hypothetical protein
MVKGLDSLSVVALLIIITSSFRCHARNRFRQNTGEKPPKTWADISAGA